MVVLIGIDKFLFPIIFLNACYSSPITSSQNCIPSGAIYTETFNVTSGFCPEIPPLIVSISEDGEYPVGESVVCGTVEQNDCQVHQYDCEYKSDNCNILSKTSLEFENDGFSAKGFISATIICDGNFVCAGTYNVTLERM